MDVQLRELLNEDLPERQFTVISTTNVWESRVPAQTAK